MSQLVTAAADDRPLSDAEALEMKQHLEFLRANRAVLRIQYNATEDLLVNGQRPPTERGVCRHLLAKLDRACVDSALAREPVRSDPVARSRLLAGAVRVTGDVGVLLSFLESLVPLRSREEAAQAFRDAVRRIDFQGLSASRLTRVLQLLLELFTGPQRVQVLLGLLSLDGFVQALDAALPQLPPEVAAATTPLRTLERASPGMTSADSTVEGLRQALTLGPAALRQLPEPMRLRMVELATAPSVPADVADAVASTFLPTLSNTTRDFSRLSMRLAAQLLGRHADDKARTTLDALKTAQPDFKLPGRWLAAMESPRVGRVGVIRGAAGKGRLAVGWWLDRQRDVVLRTAAGSEAARLSSEAALQRDLALPGVASVALDGTADGQAFVAVVGPGQPLTRGSLPNDAAGRLAVLAAMARVLRALALCGVELPDAAPERFLLAPGTPPTLTLADLDGARAVAPETAATQLARAATALVADLLDAPARAQLPPGLDTLPSLVAALEQAALAVPAAR